MSIPLQEIIARHRIYGACDIPNSEYTAGWDDVQTLLAEISRATQERDELSKEMSHCHHMLDVELGEHEEATVSIETLETRLRRYFDDLQPVITDEMVNGDD